LAEEEAAQKAAEEMKERIERRKREIAEKKAQKVRFSLLASDGFYG
jgi:hypothetical protein